MVGWMNRESLRRTLETGRTWFWSRSRQELWCKGETSGDRQYVRRAAYDCDMDALLFVVEQEGAVPVTRASARASSATSGAARFPGRFDRVTEGPAPRTGCDRRSTSSSR